MGLINGKCKKCGNSVKCEDLVDGLCYSCFFSAETVMDSIMDDLGIPKLMEVSAALKKTLNGKSKATERDIVNTLLIHDDLDLSLIDDLISGLPLSEGNKTRLRTATAKEYARRHEKFYTSY